MSKLISLLTLLKWIFDTIMGAYQLFKKKSEEKSDKKHDEAVDKLKESKTEEEQKDALRDIVNNP